ncbi:hypothetical protein [Trichocoleus sp. FACHB-262]|uniref:hypothetical protein n=1 Tax=Trichocoleus sp. FACHB-262 TaxID=2692869 RepID=UPI0016847B87|nr:hypothetical protein [Trichocoleus sp. FACHB-262]MBD2121666.1 hypothetical protein [Trichocoleus sp. FACHB-262]
MFSKVSKVAIAIALSSAAISTPTAKAEAVTNPTTTPPGTASTEMSLATHLTQANIKMYGAYNCPFSLLQRQLFGEAAFKQVTYIECNANGKNAQASLCQALQIKQTPTWEIGGHLYSGVRSLEQLARLSKYQGFTHFQQAESLVNSF